MLKIAQTAIAMAAVVMIAGCDRISLPTAQDSRPEKKTTEKWLYLTDDPQQLCALVQQSYEETIKLSTHLAEVTGDPAAANAPFESTPDNDFSSPAYEANVASKSDAFLLQYVVDHSQLYRKSYAYELAKRARAKGNDTLALKYLVAGSYVPEHANANLTGKNDAIIDLATGDVWLPKTVQYASPGIAGQSICMARSLCGDRLKLVERYSPSCK